MNRLKTVSVIVGLVGVMIFGLACGNGEAATTPSTDADAPSAPGSKVGEPATGELREEPDVASKPAIAVASEGIPEPVAVSVPAAPALPITPSIGLGAPVSGYSGYSGAPLLQAGGSQAGIWVTGEGSISLQPDLTLLNIGVETTAESVAEARDQAARAMAAIVAAVKAHGLEDIDVQTRSFNIWPQYEYPEVIESGVRVRKQTLVGYRVSNTAVVKIRDMDKVGTIIDDVANAGGDATRINGVQFTVEDPKPFMSGLREAAVHDALAKAQDFATLTGVQVGSLVFISETRAGGPVVSDFAEEAFAVKAAAAPVPSSISGGSLVLTLSVQAVFNIE